jgi:hypothetical protein
MGWLLGFRVFTVREVLQINLKFLKNPVKGRCLNKNQVPAVVVIRAFITIVLLTGAFYSKKMWLPLAFDLIIIIVE